MRNSARRRSSACAVNLVLERVWEANRDQLGSVTVLSRAIGISIAPAEIHPKSLTWLDLCHFAICSYSASFWIAYGCNYQRGSSTGLRPCGFCALERRRDCCYAPHYGGCLKDFHFIPGLNSIGRGRETKYVAIGILTLVIFGGVLYVVPNFWRPVPVAAALAAEAPPAAVNRGDIAKLLDSAWPLGGALFASWLLATALVTLVGGAGWPNHGLLCGRGSYGRSSSPASS